MKKHGMIYDMREREREIYSFEGKLYTTIHSTKALVEMRKEKREEARKRIRSRRRKRRKR